MTNPIEVDGVTMVVEIAFATTDPLTTSPTWTDVTDYVIAGNIRRGRWNELNRRADPGTCWLRFNNSDRRFDPLHAAGPYFGNLLPMKQVRIRPTYSATTYDLFRGFIDGWPQTWDLGGTYAETTITATDAFRVFANYQVPDRYAMEVLTDDPVGYWRCDDPDNEMADSGPNGFHGAWFGNTQPDDPMRALGTGSRRLPGSQAESLDIATRYNESTGSTGDQVLQDSATDGSIECLVYVAAVSQGGVQYLEFGNAPILSITFDNNLFGSGAIVFSWQNVGATAEGFLYYPTQPNQVLHVVGTYEDGGAATIYVNGQDVTLLSGLDETDFQVLSLLPGGIFVFNGLTEDENTNSFAISDIALYNTVLSLARVQAHWQAAATGMKLERSGARVTACLDYIGWPSGLRIIGDGDSWLDEGPVAGNLLDYMQQIAETEQGRLHISGDGELVFRDRTDDITRASSITSQATFGDAGAELPYVDLVLDGGHIDSIVNEVKVTPQSGATRVTSTVVDATSRGAYGPKGETINSLHSNQPDARNLGLWRLDRYSQPSNVVRQLTIRPRAAPSTLFLQALDRDLGNRITVVRRPQGVGSAISQERTIEGIEHSFTPDDWTCTWYLCAPTPSYVEGGYWRVGDATYGVVGTAAVPY